MTYRELAAAMHHAGMLLNREQGLKHAIADMADFVSPHKRALVRHKLAEVTTELDSPIDAAGAPRAAEGYQ